MAKITKYLLITVLVLVVITPIATYGYIHFVNDDAPQRLTFDVTTTTATATGSSTTAPTPPVSLDGNWTAGPPSQVGYRVNEILFGQRTEAVGRTGDITGTLTYKAGTVSAVDLTVNMASVKSDQGSRDNQFRTRIMSTDEFPTAHFVLTQPISLPQSPDVTPQSVDATGDLTLRGVTKTVTTSLQIRRNGDRIEANGTIPVVFADWQIPNPSLGPAETEDHGELELLVSFGSAANG